MKKVVLSMSNTPSTFQIIVNKRLARMSLAEQGRVKAF